MTQSLPPPDDRDPLAPIETEAALLGAMMIDNQLIASYAAALTTTDFAEPLHGRIFSAMLRFQAKGAPVNAVTLRPLFQVDSAALGGDYLDRITEVGEITVGARTFVDQILDMSARRRLREAGKKLLDRLSGDLEAPVEELAAQVQQAGWSGAAAHAEPTPVSGAFGRVRDRIRRINEAGGVTGARNALVSDIDAGMGPLEPQTYTILAGRPGMGKSTAARSMALGYAVNGHHGLYLHGEMSDDQIALCFVSDVSHAIGKPIEHKTLKTGQLDARTRHDLDHAESRAALLPLKVQCIKGWTIRQVEALVAREVALHAALGKVLEFVVVDYLQLIEAEQDGRAVSNDFEKTKLVSRAFRNLADRQNLAVIALSQLSRAVEQRVDKRPQLSDLRESGNLEQDADVVILLFREEYYHMQARPKADAPRDRAETRTPLEIWTEELNFIRGKIDFIFAKNRHGEPTTRTGRFLGAYQACRGGDFDEYSMDAGLFADEGGKW